MLDFGYGSSPDFRLVYTVDIKINHCFVSSFLVARSKQGAFHKGLVMVVDCSIGIKFKFCTHGSHLTMFFSDPTASNRAVLNCRVIIFLLTKNRSPIRVVLHSLLEKFLEECFILIGHILWEIFFRQSRVHSDEPVYYPFYSSGMGAEILDDIFEKEYSLFIH